MSGLYFDVWPADDPTGDALGELTDAYEKHYQGVHQAIGSGDFTINRNSDHAAWAVVDNFVRVRRVAGGPFDYDDARYIGAFWLESGKRTLLSEDEEGGEELTMGGRGPEAALRWAILYPDAFDSRNDQFTTHTRDDGNWHIPNRTAGEVLAIFLRDLDDRTPDPLPFISRDFTVSHDSTGEAWSDTDTDWSFPVGTNGLDLLSTCVSGGLFYRVSPAFLWQAFEDEPGRNLAASITLAEAVELAEAADQDIAARETVGRVVVQGTKESGRLKYREVVNGTVEAALPGRREGFVEYRRTPTNAKLDQAGNRYIRKSKRRHDGPLQVRYVESSGEEAFTDFVPGDIVKVNIPGDFNNASLRVYAISLEEDEAGNVTPVIDFEQSPFDPNQGDAGEFDDGPGDGSGGHGANCGDCPPLPPYVPTPIPGEDTATSGAVLWQPREETYGLTYNRVLWGGSGDNPGAGYPGPGGGGPIDAASFAYLGTHPDNEGFLIVADAGSLDIHIEFDFADVATDRTFTTHLLLNGSPVASDTFHKTGGLGFATDLFVMDVADLAVVAGDELRVDFSVSEANGAVIPAGTGATSNRFQILSTSTVHEVIVPGPLEGQTHYEELTGDGSTTEFQTNYPYAEGSLEVHVDGLLVPVTETDPPTGTFTFDTAPADGGVIIVRYQNAGTTGTGATNPYPTSSTPGSPALTLAVDEDGSTVVAAAGSLDFRHALDVMDPGGGPARIAVDESEFTYGGTGDMTAEAIASTAAAGSSGKPADAGHRHAMPSAAAPSGGYGSAAAGSAATLLRSDAVLAKPTEADISTADVTTLNVSIAKHGFAPKAPNDATKYLDGTGAYSVPTGAAIAAHTWVPVMVEDGATGLWYVVVTGVGDAVMTEVS